MIEQNCWENEVDLMAVPQLSGVDQVSSCAEKSEKSEMVSIDMVPQAKFQKSVMFFMGKQMVLESPILGIAPIFSVSKAKVTSRIITRRFSILPPLGHVGTMNTRQNGSH